MKRNIGSFYFKSTAGDNLLGELINQDSRGYITESANRLSEPDIIFSFIGEYECSWIEESNSHFKFLKIKLKEGSTNIFVLEWSEKNGRVSFWGEGMLCDNALIGHYRNFENVN